MAFQRVVEAQEKVHDSGLEREREKKREKEWQREREREREGGERGMKALNELEGRQDTRRDSSDCHESFKRCDRTMCNIAEECINID